MMQQFKQRFDAAILERQQNDLSREMRPFDREQSHVMVYQGKRYQNFSANDYLGLATDPELMKAWQEGLSRYGCGSSASPLVTGFHPAHQFLEDQLCEWLGFERAILFPSGFSANQAILFALLAKDDLLLVDRLSHASVMEAGMLSPARMKRFRHNDSAHLDHLISPDSACFAVTEGVFSMDGDCAPLAEISKVTKDRALFMVDDAHGMGVLGDGAGSCHASGIKPDLMLVTFGKAFGLSGAAVLCDQSTGDYMAQFSRHHVYSTAIPPAQAYALSHAVEMIQTQHWRRENLQRLQQCYDDMFSDLDGYVFTPTPIKPLLFSHVSDMQQVSSGLLERGFATGAIRPPAVPEGTPRLRITLTANHTEAQVCQLAKAVKDSLGCIAIKREKMDG